MSFSKVCSDDFAAYLRDALHTTCQVQLAQDFLFFTQREETIRKGCELFEDEVVHLIRETTINGWFSPIHHDSKYCSPNSSSILYPGLSAMSIILGYPAATKAVWAGNPTRLDAEARRDLKVWIDSELPFLSECAVGDQFAYPDLEWRHLGMGDSVFHLRPRYRNSVSFNDRHIFTARDERFCMKFAVPLNNFRTSQLPEALCRDRDQSDDDMPDFMSGEYDGECEDLWSISPPTFLTRAGMP